MVKMIEQGWLFVVPLYNGIEHKNIERERGLKSALQLPKSYLQQGLYIWFLPFPSLFLVSVRLFPHSSRLFIVPCAHGGTSRCASCGVWAAFSVLSFSSAIFCSWWKCCCCCYWMQFLFAKFSRTFYLMKLFVAVRTFQILHLQVIPKRKNFSQLAAWNLKTYQFASFLASQLCNAWISWIFSRNDCGRKLNTILCDPVICCVLNFSRSNFSGIRPRPNLPKLDAVPSELRNSSNWTGDGKELKNDGSMV